MFAVLENARVPLAVGDLLGKGRVFAPVEQSGRFVFDRVRAADQVRLDAPQTVHSAKLGLFPPSDPLLIFDLRARSWQSVVDTEPVVLLGIHPCDSWGLEAFDRWMRDGIPDDVYLRRRERCLVIGVTCNAPCNQTSYCGVMRTFTPFGGDLWLSACSNGWMLEACSVRGEEVFKDWRAFLRDPTEEEAAIREHAAAAATAGFANSESPLDLEKLPRDLAAAAKAGFWQDLAERCLDCGQCVAVCPTCTCFGMLDASSVDLTRATRERVWDGCVFEPFAEIAGGHNFRRDRSARLRHRMNRKGNWLSQQFGVPFCTGCGRCVATCPVGISPLKVFRKVQGHEVDI